MPLSKTSTEIKASTFSVEIFDPCPCEEAVIVVVVGDNPFIELITDFSKKNVG